MRNQGPGVDHDQNFKNLIVDYPREALRFFAPEEAAEIDDSCRILPLREEQLKERLNDRFRELDLPLLVEWPDGRREALLFLVEHESSGHRFSIHRLAHYCLDVAEVLKIDRVAPVVIFLRRGRRKRELILGGDRHHYLTFRYIACDLGSLSAEEHAHSDNLVALLNLPNMHYPPERKVEFYAAAIKGLLTLEQDPERILKYSDFVDIYAALDDNQRQQYRRHYAEEIEQMATPRYVGETLDRARQEGRQEGRREGWQEGRQEGEATVLIRLLQRKFGNVPPEIHERIQSADADTLIVWSERILTADSVDEVVH